jgi:hypothetical protein
MGSLQSFDVFRWVGWIGAKAIVREYHVDDPSWPDGSWRGAVPACRNATGNQYSGRFLGG